MMLMLHRTKEKEGTSRKESSKRKTIRTPGGQFATKTRTTQQDCFCGESSRADKRNDVIHAFPTVCPTPNAKKKKAKKEKMQMKMKGKPRNNGQSRSIRQR